VRFIGAVLTGNFVVERRASDITPASRIQPLRPDERPWLGPRMRQRMGMPRHSWRSALRTVALIVLSLTFEASTAGAQQFVTNDAAIVDRDARQIEAWYAQPATWVLPACQLVRNVELTAGIGRVEVQDDDHQLRYVFQAKTLFRQQDAHGLGAGVDCGYRPGPARADRRAAHRCSVRIRASEHCRRRWPGGPA
jgi:hypothetical protein